MKRFFTALALAAPLFLAAQNPKPMLSGNEGFLYSKEKSMSLALTSGQGWRVSFERGDLKTYYKTSFFRLSLGEMKSEKEHRQSADVSFTGARSGFRSYVFGKKNNLFAARAGWGRKRYYTEKARTRGVAVGYSAEIGPTLGILKPYYVALRRSTPNDPGNFRVVTEKFSDDNRELFLDPSKIVGAAPIWRGLLEPTIAPGGHFFFALHIDWGAFDDFVKGADIGLAADFFPRRAEILASGDNPRLMLNFFAALQFGKRR